MARDIRGTAGRARESLRRWRRTRPFWGGLLLLLAGIELLLIPVGNLLLHGPINIVIYIGIGGVFGILFGALLIVCGLALWADPEHRTFYAVGGVLLALVSFITTNLGGFFIGMLLGIIGGSLAFAWVPGTKGPPEGGTGELPPPGTPDDGLSFVLGPPPSGAAAPPGGPVAPPRRMPG